MAKTDPTRALMKRLQKLEQAVIRLADVSTRIRTQADTVADLVRATEGPRAKAAASTRRSRAPAGSSGSART